MLDRNSQKPLHMQMEEIIRAKLETKEWIVGQAIPSENELSHIYGISRMTVRNVITRLVQEDLLVRSAGKGTFVKEPKIIAKSLSYAGIREQLELMGYEVSTKLISISKRTVNEHVRSIFNCRDKSTKFYIVKRLRFLRDSPLSLHTSYIPVELCPNLEKLELEKEQLCEILSDVYGITRSRMVETLESTAATADEAELLRVNPEHPLLLLEDTIFDADNNVFEYAKVVFRGEKIKLHLEF